MRWPFPTGATAPSRDTNGSSYMVAHHGANGHRHYHQREPTATTSEARRHRHLHVGDARRTATRPHLRPAPRAVWPRSADGHHGSCRTCACTRALSCFPCRPPTNFVTCLFPNVHADCRRTPAPNATSIELPTPHGRWLFAPLEPAKPDKSQRQGPC